MSDAVSASAGNGLTLSFDADARAVIARNAPADDAAPITEDWLHEQLAARGWGALRPLPDAIAVLLASYHKGSAVEALRIAEMADGSFEVTLSEDAMQAVLTLKPPCGGEAVSSDTIMQHLAEMGILSGVDQAALADAVIAESAEGVVVARGREPAHGKDGSLERLLPEARNRAPKVSETGQVDYRDLGDILVVHPGEALMRRHPPTTGVPGRTLIGAILPAREGKAVMFGGNLPGTAMSADDPDLLTAAITGQPVEVRGGMMVEPVLVIEAVTMASGNIKFDGSVVIRGDVSAGMHVEASGDIEVGGVVELSALDAGGSIVVRGGIIGGLGRKDSAVLSVRAQVNVEVGYAQNARVEAGDCIVIDDTAVQCELIAANHILVGRKKRGCLIGGRHQATLSVTAKEVGSAQRVATVFDIGINPATHKRMLELAKNHDAKEAQLAEVGKLLTLAQLQPGKLPPAMVEKAQQTATALGNAIVELREQSEAMNHQVGLAMGARVIATQKLHEGVQVHMGERHFKVPSEFEACAIGLDRKGNLGLLAIDEDEGDPSV